MEGKHWEILPHLVFDLLQVILPSKIAHKNSLCCYLVFNLVSVFKSFGLYSQPKSCYWPWDGWDDSMMNDVYDHMLSSIFLVSLFTLSRRQDDGAYIYHEWIKITTRWYTVFKCANLQSFYKLSHTKITEQAPNLLWILSATRSTSSIDYHSVDLGLFIGLFSILHRANSLLCMQSSKLYFTS